MQAAGITAEQRRLTDALENAVTLGNISKNKATELQTLVNTGELAVVAEELRAAEAMQTERVGAEERMQTEQLTAEQTRLTDALQTEVTLGNISKNKATEVQTLINSGDLALAQKELEAQTGRLDLEREVAAGEVTIDGRRTKTLEAGRLELEEDLTNAQLRTLYRTEQGQSIANMIAMVNTLPEGEEKTALEAQIATAVTGSIEEGALQTLLINMMDVSEADYIRQEGGEDSGIEFPLDPKVVTQGGPQYDSEEAWLANNPQPKGYDKRGGGGNPGKEPEKTVPRTGRYPGPPRTNPDWTKWNRRATEFAAWERRRQIFLDSI
jgi:hypothetical protein